jgi:glutathione S-transferase
VADHFGKIEVILEEATPMMAALSRRVSDLPPLAKLAAKASKTTATPIAAARSRRRCAKVLKA